MSYPTKKLVCEFLHIFSRFEYALKRTHFLKKGASGNAEADWDKLAKSLNKKFLLKDVGSDEFKKSVVYFFECPPKKQVVDSNGGLEWKEATISGGQQDFEKLLVLVRRVRNNLFHGGKFKNGKMSGSERDKKLISSSISILEGCLHLDSDVEREFRKEIFNIYDN